jgi:hypothetical protein
MRLVIAQIAASDLQIALKVNAFQWAIGLASG